MRVRFRYDKGAAHSTLDIWVNGAHSGRLTVRVGDEETILKSVADTLQSIPGVKWVASVNGMPEFWEQNG